MAVRLRDIMLLAWDGVWYGDDPERTLDLQGLIDLTDPGDWNPPVATLEDWNTNQANGGNDIDRVKATEIAQAMTATEPRSR